MTAPSKHHRLVQKRLAEFIAEQERDGVPIGVVGDVMLSAGVYTLHEVVGKHSLIEHLENVIDKAGRPSFQFGDEVLQ